MIPKMAYMEMRKSLLTSLKLPWNTKLIIKNTSVTYLLWKQIKFCSISMHGISLEITDKGVKWKRGTYNLKHWVHEIKKPDAYKCKKQGNKSKESGAANLLPTLQIHGISLRHASLSLCIRLPVIMLAGEW